MSFLPLQNTEYWRDAACSVQFFRTPTLKSPILNGLSLNVFSALKYTSSDWAQFMLSTRLLCSHFYLRSRLFSCVCIRQPQVGVVWAAIAESASAYPATPRCELFRPHHAATCWEHLLIPLRLCRALDSSLTAPCRPALCDCSVLLMFHFSPVFVTLWFYQKMSFKSLMKMIEQCWL